MVLIGKVDSSTVKQAFQEGMIQITGRQGECVTYEDLKHRSVRYLVVNCAEVSVLGHHLSFFYRGRRTFGWCKIIHSWNWTDGTRNVSSTFDIEGETAISLLDKAYKIISKPESVVQGSTPDLPVDLRR